MTRRKRSIDEARRLKREATPPERHHAVCGLVILIVYVLVISWEDFEMPQRLLIFQVSIAMRSTDDLDGLLPIPLVRLICVGL